jgi:multidrug efflux pump subunit AcrA (membrane-fusion protein)
MQPADEGDDDRGVAVTGRHGGQQLADGAGDFADAGDARGAAADQESDPDHALALETGVKRGDVGQTVRALQDGTVGAVLAEPGQSVAAPAALATLIPAGSVLQAQLFVPSRAIGFIEPGQAVRLRFEAYPYQKFGHRTGRVMQVSRAPLAGPELATLAGASSGAEPLFRITVAIDAGEGAQASLPLTAGMRLAADLMLDRRRLIEWLFEPLLGLEDRL